MGQHSIAAPRAAVLALFLLSGCSPDGSSVSVEAQEIRRGSPVAPVGTAPAVAAPQFAAPSQAEIERAQEEYEDQLRRSTLTGDGLAIALPNGDVLPVGRADGCRPPEAGGGLIKVDCTLTDGPAYYFDEATRAMVESCSFWFLDQRRCPPKQWPIDVPGCRGTVSSSIIGEWRFFATPTAGGFFPVDAVWRMTLSDQTITFDFGEYGVFERAYEVVNRESQRYSLEVRDSSSATTLVDLELAPCGLLVESAGICDAFCENLADEIGAPSDEQVREIAEQLAGVQDPDAAAKMEALIRESIDQGPQSIFPERSFFAGGYVQ